MRARLKMVVMVIMVIHDGDGDCHGGGVGDYFNAGVDGSLTLVLAISDQ